MCIEVYTTMVYVMNIILIVYVKQTPAAVVRVQPNFVRLLA